MALRDLINHKNKLKQQDWRQHHQLEHAKHVKEKTAKEKEELAIPNRQKGFTGVATQPIDPKIENKIESILLRSWPQQLSKSFTRPSYQKYIKHLIMTADVFRSYPTYKDEAVAHQVMIDISGLGIIQRLFDYHPDITDMGFNGRFLTYKTNNAFYRYGQQWGEKASLLNKDTISLFINKFIFNKNNNQSLNDAHPTFDGEVGYLRVSIESSEVTPPGIGPTFSLRRSLPKLALNYNNFKYNSPMAVYGILGILIQAHCNTLISGITGSGKTELQKMLVGFIPDDEKIIMIEDTPETHLQELPQYKNKDILTWETNAHIDLAGQVAESLRNDAIWVMVSETRGPEAYEMFQSVKTGHHLTTTLHASSNAAVPSRFAGMCELAPGLDVKEEALKKDFVDFMNIGIHMNAKKIGNYMFRFIDEIAEFLPYTYYSRDSQGNLQKHTTNGTHPIFRQRLINHNGVCIRKYQYFKPTHFLQNQINEASQKTLNMPNVDQATGKSPIKQEIVVPPSSKK